jgi:DNA-binding HxlR family transcriptional regulator
VPASALGLLSVLADNPGLDAAGLSKAAGFHGFEKTARFLTQLQRDGLITQTPSADLTGAPLQCSLTRRGHNFLRRAAPRVPLLPVPTAPVPSPARDPVTVPLAAAHASPRPRYTHRTLMVLVTVCELTSQGSPPSNMAIAKAAGIIDGGQVSKLLKRLEGLDLLSRPNRPTAAFANRWSLTPSGRQLLNRRSLQHLLTQPLDQQQHLPAIPSVPNQ